MRRAQKIVCGMLAFLICYSAPAEMRKKGELDSSEILESLKPEPMQVNPGMNSRDSVARYLATGNTDDDLSHFHSLGRRLGVDLGMMIPFNDFSREFAYAPLIGLHLTWDAIPPFGLIVSMQRTSGPHKNGANIAKLSTNAITIGTIATFPVRRFLPYMRLEGAFYFNDVSFNDGRTITSGNDINLTTVGINAGLGIDFVVGREVSFGLDITYHYCVPKKLGLSDGTTFDLGSPFATMGVHVNF